MLEQVLVKTHLIVTDVHDEYEIKWCDTILNSNPLIENDLPIFVIVGREGRSEINTADMKRVEECAKRKACPRGKASITKDTSDIYIKEVDGNEKLVGTVTKRHIRHYAPMYDPVYYK